MYVYGCACRPFYSSLQHATKNGKHGVLGTVFPILADRSVPCPPLDSSGQKQSTTSTLRTHIHSPSALSYKISVPLSVGQRSSYHRYSLCSYVAEVLYSVCLLEIFSTYRIRHVRVVWSSTVPVRVYSRRAKSRRRGQRSRYVAAYIRTYVRSRFVYPLQEACSQVHCI